MANELVIVESPAKAKTLGKILGRGFEVKSSLGHVRDLPRSQLGVDVERDFAPKYLVPREKRKVVQELKEAAAAAASVYLATDPDREGEAISWHLIEAAKIEGAARRRVVFHEITREAIEQAFRHPRSINMRLVDAQQARRILDRLVGYKLSPLLWRKVRGGLSAGRVQSVVVRMIVDREREIQGFLPVEYWTIEAELLGKAPPSFRAALIGLADGTKLELGRQEEAEGIAAELEKAVYTVARLRRKDMSRQPAPPFITSTLQQEAWRKLRFSASHTMRVAQQLYEGLTIGREGTVGLITYMRTDSTRVAASAIAAVRDFIGQKYGRQFLTPHPRRFRKKAKAAQEAHEAIRPTRVWSEPNSLLPHLNPDQFKLYQLIWSRMVASQMLPLILDNLTVEVEAQRPGGEKSYLLRASSSSVKFPGFTIVYRPGREEAEEEETEKPQIPELVKGEELKLMRLFPEQHFTQPPFRYNEASLVKALEENGIGRPSTYAPILATIQERDYVQKKEGRFHPEELGFIVNDLLAEHFPNVIDIGFTAQMESELDQVAQGEKERVNVLRDFYLPFESTLSQASLSMGIIELAEEPSDEVCPLCGQTMVVKRGRYGKFLACTGYPQCKGKKSLRANTGVSCPQCGGELVKRMSKKRRTFYGCSNFPECRFTISRPKAATAKAKEPVDAKS